MHTFLRAVGFSKCKSKKELNNLIAAAVKDADEKLYTTLNDDIIFAEYNLFCGENIGISVRGEYDEENQFLPDYSIPFFRGSQISSYADNSVERHAEKESYAGICDDVRIGVSLIYYLQNVVGYIKRKVGGQLPMKGTTLTLAGLSLSGTILLPIEKDESDLKKTRKMAHNRHKMIMKARNGDEDAIESLTLDDMDTYSNITKMIIKQDILSLVDNYFMPYGVECDQYAILGEILDVNCVKNKITNEKVWQMTLSCNDLIFDVCINSLDLFGEPAVGRRFKGNIWLQGMIHFPA